MNSSNREGKGKESWIGLVVYESRDIASLLFSLDHRLLD